MLAIIHALFVTAYANDFYPRLSFFFWVTEFLIHYPLTPLFTALFYLQIGVGITLFLIIQRKIWKDQAKR